MLVAVSGISPVLVDSRCIHQTITTTIALSSVTWLLFPNRLCLSWRQRWFLCVLSSSPPLSHPKSLPLFSTHIELLRTFIWLRARTSHFTHRRRLAHHVMKRLSLPWAFHVHRSTISDKASFPLAHRDTINTLFARPCQKALTRATPWPTQGFGQVFGRRQLSGKIR